ncbi:hypothetical protein BHE74_00003609 [Ensete ventricosum]|nr:hypothetical protein BHE74_00003609 [Ensete ventricosum]
MFNSSVYYENSLIGEVEVYPRNPNAGSWLREIRISHLSPSSERCPPLAILHTVASGGVRFKMESKSPLSKDSPMSSLHATLFSENKINLDQLVFRYLNLSSFMHSMCLQTAVIALGEEELHLVAMASRKNPMPYACFWGFSVLSRLYESSLLMLNLRCLGIVFDLDETLLVANTMRSFEDRIDALQRKISNETDPLRIAGMLTEIKRYHDDKSILKQYAENDQVVENGKVFKVQSEMVPPLSGQLASPEPSFQGSPAREEGEVPESELDPDTRRRLLILQHGQDTREPTPSFPVSPPLHVSIPPVQPQGSWFPLEEEIDPRQQDSEPKEFSREPDPGRYRKRSRHPSFMHGGENTVPSDRVLHEPRRLPIQVTYAFDLVSVRY